MVDLVEDAKGICPCPAGGLDVACAVLGAAEVIERIGFVETIGEFPVEVDGPLVARVGSIVTPQPTMNVAEAIPGSGLPVALSQLPDGGQCLLTIGIAALWAVCG